MLGIAGRGLASLLLLAAALAVGWVGAGVLQASGHLMGYGLLAVAGGLGFVSAAPLAHRRRKGRRGGDDDAVVVEG